jgi:HSP20 family protein
MRQQMDQIFNALSGGFAGGPAAGVFPLTNVTESKDSYCVRAELPGIVSDDLDIQVTSNGISLSGERKIAEEGESVQYHRREREAGKFSRLIELPGEVDTDKVEASLKNGILTISVPKSETAKPRQITIK